MCFIWDSYTGGRSAERQRGNCVVRIWSRIIYCALIILLVFVGLCVTARPAYAYVDPGSGLFFLQVIGSTFAGFTFLIRRRLARLMGIAGEDRAEQPAPSIAPTSGNESH